MSEPSKEKPKTLRQIVEDTLTFQRTQDLWTANYFPAFPFTLQDFQIGALLPAMLYMARFGHRRGKGKFVATFGTRANIANVVKTLLDRPESALIGFDSVAGPEVSTINFHGPHRYEKMTQCTQHGSHVIYN